VKEGPERIREIIEWGAQFDKDADGDYSLVKKADTALTGYCIIRILQAKKWKEL
jgi:L-aspartate oxidase